MEKEFIGLLLQDRLSFKKVYAEGNIFITPSVIELFDTMIDLEDKGIKITPQSIHAHNKNQYEDRITEYMMLADEKDLFDVRFNELQKAYYQLKLQKALGKANQYKNIKEMFNEIECAMTTDKKELSDFSTIKDMHVEYMENKENKHVKSGYPFIDRYVRFCTKQLIIIGARPKTGKTSLMIDMISKALNNGYKVGAFSMEVNKPRFDAKFISTRIELDSNLIYDKLFTNDTEMLVANELDKTKDMPLYIMDKRVDINYIVKKIRYLKKKHDIDQIYIDHLHYIKYSGKENRIEQLANMVNTLAELKNELDITIFLLAQLNRESEANPRPPRMSDLKGCGDIEQSADIIMLMHKREIINKKRSYMDIGIVSRYTSGGIMNTTFEQDITQFREIKKP